MHAHMLPHQPSSLQWLESYSSKWLKSLQHVFLALSRTTHVLTSPDFKMQRVLLTPGVSDSYDTPRVPLIFLSRFLHGSLYEKHLKLCTCASACKLWMEYGKATAATWRGQRMPTCPITTGTWLDPFPRNG